MAARPRFSIGDVFRVSLSSSAVAYGQIASRWGNTKGHFYFLGYRSAYDASTDPALDAIVGDAIALLALSLDALLYHGHWSVIGNRAVDESRIAWPTYKVATAPGVFVIEDHLGNQLRPATDDQVAALKYRSVIAPIRFENAMKALHGLVAWLPEFQDLLIP
jgi:hypothetical protein